jgi:hypothetical protein
MGIETSADHGGSESSFTAAIIAIEELAKIDPSVSVMCDVHNTLVNTIFRKYANKEQQDKWLPQLAENKVRIFIFQGSIALNSPLCSWVRSASPNPHPGLMPLRFRPVRRRRETNI